MHVAYLLATYLALLHHMPWKQSVQQCCKILVNYKMVKGIISI